MFTDNNSVLTDEQRTFYEKNGFIMFRNLVNHKLLDECHQRFVDVCNQKVNHGVMLIMKDQSLKHNSDVQGEYLINKVQDWLYDDVLFKYGCDKDIVKVVSSIIGPDITGIHSMLINKPPDSDADASRHPLHQDLHYFPLRPAHRIVASWTAMERIDEKNGCLFAVPGSHKWSLYPHVYPENIKNKAYHGVIGFDDLPKVDLIMEKGDTVFFHPLLLHGSGPNRTKGFRKAISVHYANSHCAFVDVKGTSQANIAKEVEEMALKKSGGLPVSFQDAWRYKSRLVQGNVGSFEVQSKL